MTLHKSLSKSAGSLGKIVSETRKNMTLSDYGISHYRASGKEIKEPEVPEVEAKEEKIDTEFLKFR